MLKSGQRVQIIDTRPRHYSSRAQDMMEGAVWRDPERIDDWIGELSKTDPVVTFCVYGFHIGCQTATALRKAGFDARSLRHDHRKSSVRRNDRHTPPSLQIIRLTIMWTFWHFSDLNIKR